MIPLAGLLGMFGELILNYPFGYIYLYFRRNKYKYRLIYKNYTLDIFFYYLNSGDNSLYFHA